MLSFKSRVRIAAVGILSVSFCGLSAAHGASEESEVAALRALIEEQKAALATLERKVRELEENPVFSLGRYVRVETDEILGVKGPHVIFEGANVHIRSGRGFTNDYQERGKNLGPLSGLGNLIIGYNEVPYDNFTLRPGDRSGSHNFVTGVGLRFSSYGGIVHGWENTTSGRHAAVISGDSSTASGNHSVIVGGWENETTGNSTTIAGGKSNTAKVGLATILGGHDNTASGRISTVVGGGRNHASGHGTTVIGGQGLSAEGTYGWVAAGGSGEEKEELKEKKSEEP